MRSHSAATALLAWAFFPGRAVVSDATGCASLCGGDRPFVDPDIYNGDKTCGTDLRPRTCFQDLIANCLGDGDDDDDCPYDGDIGCWDTSEITNMDEAFERQASFDEELCWDTSRVTTMVSMFENAASFNRNLDWNVGRVESMRYMFNKAGSFNKDINEWDVSSVNDMALMFEEAMNFNRCLSTWAEKTPGDVRTSKMFLFTSCPVGRSWNDPDPDPEAGPWCQDNAQGCGIDNSSAPSPAPAPTSPSDSCGDNMEKGNCSWRDGCEWKNKKCKTIKCEKKKTEEKCNKKKGCSWLIEKVKCKVAKTTSQCVEWMNDSDECEKNGCWWREENFLISKCVGRWY